MIVIRRYQEDNPDGDYIDLSKSQVELVTDDGIAQLLGDKGIYDELRGRNNIFNKDEEFVSVMSNELEPGCSGIYFSSEDADLDRFTICFNGSNMARLYGLNHSSTYLAVNYVADFIINVVVKDESYFSLLEPDDVGIMVVTMYCYLERNSWVYDVAEFKHIFDKVYDMSKNALAGPIPDLEDVTSYINNCIDS